MDQELKTAIENSNKLIETQRSAIEAKADAETVKRIEANLAKALEEKSAIEIRLADVETKMARPGAPVRGEVDEHKTAFISFMRKSQDSGAKAALESKAANISIAGGAGIAVPSVIEAAVLTQLVNENPLRGLARVISVSTPDYTEILDRANAGTAWVGETDTRGTTTAPDLAAIQPKFGTLHATVEVSQENRPPLSMMCADTISCAPVLGQLWTFCQGESPSRKIIVFQQGSGGGNATAVEPSLAPELNLAAQHTVFGPI